MQCQAFLLYVPCAAKKKSPCSGLLRWSVSLLVPQYLIHTALCFFSMLLSVGGGARLCISSCSCASFTVKWNEMYTLPLVFNRNTTGKLPTLAKMVEKQTKASIQKSCKKKFRIFAQLKQTKKRKPGNMPSFHFLSALIWPWFPDTYTHIEASVG